MKNVKLVASALTVAGSDSSGGAGIQADLKTFMAHGVYGASVITAITAQNTVAVNTVYKLPISLIIDQIDAVLGDLNVVYIKIGMLNDAATICALADYFVKRRQYRLIIDPVMISKSNKILLDLNAISTFVKRLLPLAYILTPNYHELKTILKATSFNGDVTNFDLVANHFLNLNCPNLLVKGGHIDSQLDHVVDLLYLADQKFVFEHDRYSNKFTHGTGCSLSSAICANLVLNYDIKAAVKRAIDFVANGIKTGILIGAGHNPINYFLS